MKKFIGILIPLQMASDHMQDAVQNSEINNLSSLLHHQPRIIFSQYSFLLETFFSSSEINMKIHEIDFIRKI